MDSGTLSPKRILQLVGTKIGKMKYADLADFIDQLKFAITALAETPVAYLKRINLDHNRDFYSRQLNRKLMDAAIRKKELWAQENLVPGEQTLFGTLHGDAVDMGNYNRLIHRVRVSTLPDHLQEGHAFFIRSHNQYATSKPIKETIDDYLADLNAYIVTLPKKKQEYIFEPEDKGYSGRKFTGRHYKDVKNMGVAEIAKLIREELKVRYDDVARFSVTSDTFSGGSSIDVIVTDTEFDPYSDQYSEHLRKNNDWNEYRTPGGNYPDKYNDRAKKLLDEVEAVINQYNFDDSDSQIDYFHVNFYDHVRFEDTAIIKRYYPDNVANNKSLEWHKEYREKAEKANAAARARKGKYPKYAPILYVSTGNSSLAAGEYPGMVLRSPNGQSRFTAYSVLFWVDKRRNRDGNVFPLSEPVKYTSENANEQSLKPDPLRWEVAQKKFDVGQTVQFLLEKDYRDYYGTTVLLKAGIYEVKIERRKNGMFPVYDFSIPVKKFNQHKKEYYDDKAGFYYITADRLRAIGEAFDSPAKTLSEAEAEALALKLALLKWKNGDEEISGTGTCEIGFSKKEIEILRDVYAARILGFEGAIEYLHTSAGKQWYGENNLSVAYAIRNKEYEIEEARDDIKFLEEQGYPFQVTNKHLFDAFLRDLDELHKTRIGREHIGKRYSEKEYHALYFKLEEYFEEKFGAPDLGCPESEAWTPVTWAGVGSAFRGWEIELEPGKITEDGPTLWRYRLERSGRVVPTQDSRVNDKVVLTTFHSQEEAIEAARAQINFLTEEAIEGGVYRGCEIKLTGMHWPTYQGPMCWRFVADKVGAQMGFPYSSPEEALADAKKHIDEHFKAKKHGNH
jgi:hypothetical protein